MNTCYKCQQEICFDWNRLNKSGKPIPLNLDGTVHAAICGKSPDEVQALKHKRRTSRAIDNGLTRDFKRAIS